MTRQGRHLRPLYVLVGAGLAATAWLLWQWSGPRGDLARSLLEIRRLTRTSASQSGPAVSGRCSITEAEGSLRHLRGRTLDFALQAPDRFRIAATFNDQALAIGRNGDELWVHAPTQRFAVIGRPGVPRFTARADSGDNRRLGPIPTLSALHALAFPLALRVSRAPPEIADSHTCRVLRVEAGPFLVRRGVLPRGELGLWIRDSDRLPVRARWIGAAARPVTVEIPDLSCANGPADPATWRANLPPDHHTVTAAVSHLTRFVASAISLLQQPTARAPTPTEQRLTVASVGDGRLELHDGVRVLFLQGSSEAMGRQHGALLTREVREVVDRMLYGVGVGSSFAKGRWFFGEIEEAWAAAEPFMDPRHIREMDALAEAAGLDRQEVRLANVFPELFHCSGFALMGRATKDGRIYHGRILDYLKGVGLEPNAVVIVHRPEYGHAWINIGYAGFIGSVTAMNDQHISIGEMGGRGEGRWQGKPMAQLVREVMERASSLDEAVEIMRRGPRTCEYYYVIADGRRRSAVAIRATPDTFETVGPGEAHPLLPHPIPDTVLLSAGERYEALVARVRKAFGSFDADRARDLMKRPVAMDSNIQSVLFAPDTLDLWVAKSDGRRIASDSRYVRFNLRELLDAAPAGRSPHRRVP